jgi:hypothetical protein
MPMPTTSLRRDPMRRHAPCGLVLSANPMPHAACGMGMRLPCDMRPHAAPCQHPMQPHAPGFPAGTPERARRGQGEGCWVLGVVVYGGVCGLGMGVCGCGRCGARQRAPRGRLRFFFFLSLSARVAHVAPRHWAPGAWLFHLPLCLVHNGCEYVEIFYQHTQDLCFHAPTSIETFQLTLEQKF